MDSTDNPRSTKIPIQVTVTSDSEPVKSNGFYCALETPQSGFELEYCAGESQYKVTHTPTATILAARGVICYTMEFGSAPTAFRLASGYGDLEFKLLTKSRDAIVTTDGVHIALEYALESADGEQTPRSVVIDARFIPENRSNNNED